MASAAQTVANRSNAQKSTGPRTAEGKAKVARNAVKRGLLARAAVLQGEDPEEFAEYREQLLEELDANGTSEVVLAERIVSLSWWLQRAARSQNAAFEALYDQHAADPQSQTPAPEPSPDPDQGVPADEPGLLGRMLVEDFGGQRVLERLLMYGRRIESSLYRTLAELEERQRWRQERGVSSWKCEVPSEPSRAWNPPVPSLPHQISSSAVPTSAEPPYGVTVSAPDVREPSCETNPIGGSARGTGILPVIQNHGQDAHATETPGGVTTNGTEARGQSCETKPISRGFYAGQVLYSTEVMADSAPDGPGENKANSREPGACEAVVCSAGELPASRLCTSNTGI